MVLDKIAVDRSAVSNSSFAFSVCTLVRNRDKYGEMVDSFMAAGFGADVEYLYIDNSVTNRYSAYAGLNHLLKSSGGRYVILCHEDIKLLGDDRAVLETRLSELSLIDPNWALAGNAGALTSGMLVERITNRNGEESSSGPFPSCAISLDENFFVVKGGLCIGFSSDLTGFHMYGLDICLHARLAGYTSYVINFHLLHEGKGERGEAFYWCLDQFEEKWSKHLRPKLLFTTCALVALGQTRSHRRMMKVTYKAKFSTMVVLAKLIRSTPLPQLLRKLTKKATS